MTLPTATIPTGNADAGTDSPNTARGDILLTMQQVNEIRDHLNPLGPGLAVGTYSASTSNLVNISSAPVVFSTYTQLGNLVTVQVRVQMTVTLVAPTQFDLTIPVPRTFSDSTQASGQGVAWGNTSLEPLGLSAVPGASRVSVVCRPAAAGLHATQFGFSYLVA
jgi:hypothetical protein